MIIVIEGADLTGKTTLVEELCNNLDNSITVNYTTIPKTIDDKDLGFYVRYVDEQVFNIVKQLNDKTVVFDRFMLSEIVYSKYFNRRPAYSLNEITRLNLFTVILHSKKKYLKKRYAIRDDRHLRLEEIIKINDLYYDLYQSNLIYNKNYVLFENEHKKDLKIILKSIIEKIEK